jgi:hypothetical protein
MTDGGPAFPKTNTNLNGMSMLDWFAGVALQGLLSDYGPKMTEEEAIEVAYCAYLQAEKMLFERLSIRETLTDTDEPEEYQ